MILLRLFSRRWWWATLLAIAGVAVLVRLGFWQLDRLDQRRAYNARVQEQLDSPPLALTAESIHADLFSLEYRTVTVTGQYDFDYQVSLRNQGWRDLLGVHLLTPLRITDTDMAVIVDRGWIPMENADPANWPQFDEPGEVTVLGTLRRPQESPQLGGVADPTLAPGETGLDAWSLVNLARIEEQIPYPILDVYIQQAAEPVRIEYPYRNPFDLELTEGNHLSYALQWFSFASILAIGYPVFVNRRESLGEKYS